MRHGRLALPFLLAALASLAAPLAAGAATAPPLGYYRTPAIRGDVVVFGSEGDLWRVPVTGGVATRLTTHPGEESWPQISPDGATVAFTGQYEGPTEVYTMPIDGGLPTRRTYDGVTRGVTVVGWTPGGKILYTTSAYATLPAQQLFTLDPASGAREPVELAQASDGVFTDDGRTLYFTRFPFQGSYTKRYKGGTAQSIWTYAAHAPEARVLTADYAGTSRRPMWWQNRVYFISDRDGTMNLWSMAPDGTDLKQLTHHAGFDVASPSLGEGRIVYQLGADLRLYDIASATDRVLDVRLASDFDQTREQWVKKPLDYLTSAHIAPDGSALVLTARGRVFVAPARQGRLVEATRRDGVRYRGARMMPGGKSVVALSDQSGEVELWTVPANGVGAPAQLTRDGRVLRWEAVPSPDGRWIAHHDKDQRLWLYDTRARTNRLADTSSVTNFDDLRWSPDGQWLAYVDQAFDLFQVIKVLHAPDGRITRVTTDRYDSYSPAWSPDGKWLYLLSDRAIANVTRAPWGSYQPEPFLAKTTRIYQLALRRGLRSPFHAQDELHPAGGGDASATAAGGADTKAPSKAKKPDAKKGAGAAASGPAPVTIDLDGIETRLVEVPIAPGNYSDLFATDKGLFWLARETGETKRTLMAAPIANENVETKTVLADVTSVEQSADGKKVLVRKGDAFYILEPAVAPVAADDLEKKSVPLGAWSLSIVPREEWRQMFTEAWRLERDYFYDRGLHGVDWPATLARYRPLVDRVATRAELSNLISQMVGELSTLHTFVYGGDLRTSPDNIRPGALGAILARDASAGGYRVTHVYRSDPDTPNRRSPLAEPGVDVVDGDVIETVNGTPVLSVADPQVLFRQKSGVQVLLHVKPGHGGPARDVVVTPISPDSAADLRYAEWELSRRQKVEEWGKGDIGYVHLRAMGANDYADWARNFYPVFTRKGLIIDVRNNTGGNIDSWILEKLMRKAWFYWTQRVGRQPLWNMQYAFRGHVAVLCNENTASDGEAFSEGVKRLGLGHVIGTRTWGGEVWLSSDDFLVDRGIATAAEYGVYGPDGQWLIEGHGVDPDSVVDNPPHATFGGEDAQLRAAVAYLQQQIREHPVEIPPYPVFPNKSFTYPTEK